MSWRIRSQILAAGSVAGLLAVHWGKVSEPLSNMSGSSITALAAIGLLSFVGLELADWFEKRKEVTMSHRTRMMAKEDGLGAAWAATRDRDRHAEWRSADDWT